MATASSGSSSIRSATSSSPMLTARRRPPPRTEISPTSSGPASSVAWTSISAPIRRNSVTQCQARRVDTDASHRDLGVRMQGGGDQPRRRCRWIPGHLELEWSRARRSAQDGDEALAPDSDAGPVEEPLGVVAGRPGSLDRRLALGAQCGQRRRTEELRARHRQDVARRFKRSTPDDGYRRMSVLRGDLGAGRSKELGDALHGPGSERVVPIEGDAQWQSGHRAGQQTHRGAGVAAVEFRVARGPAPDHEPPRTVLGDLDPQLAEAGHRREHVLAGRANADRRRAAGERADDQCPMGDRLVGRHREPAPQSRRREDRRRGWDRRHRPDPDAAA